MSEPQVEIRIITFRRPKLLLRALECLRAQTHTNWRAIVFDDSVNAEGRQVVHEFRDPRVTYRLNKENLGMVRNTSQAFAASPFFAGSQFACVLEDDNLYGPRFLETNVAGLHATKLPVLCRNYHVADVLDDGTLTHTTFEPMRELWGDVPRAITKDERVREAFFSFALGNLSYFWKLAADIDLSVSHERLHGPVSEASRAIGFAGDCWYEPEPLSTFSRFVSKRQTPRSETPASAHLRRVAKISEIRFTRCLVNTWTKNLGRSLPELLATAAKRPDGAECVQRLAEAGCWSAMLRLRSPRALLSSVKAQMVAMKYEKEWLAIHATC